jgi:hypothetical protein
MTTKLTKAQLESITPDSIVNHRKVKAMLANMDIHNDDPQWLPLMRKGVAAREQGGLTWAQVEAYLDDVKALY